jgi:hypothetical protein
MTYGGGFRRTILRVPRNVIGRKTDMVVVFVLNKPAIRKQPDLAALGYALARALELACGS